MEAKFGVACGIPAENATRWNSTFRQIRAVCSKGFNNLNQVLISSHHEICVFSAVEWAQLEELVLVLEPFKDATDTLQGDKVRVLIDAVLCFKDTLYHLVTADA